MRRLMPVLVAAALTLAAGAGVAVPASAETPTLDRPMNGQAAVQALGSRLAAVAAQHQTTTAESASGS